MKTEELYDMLTQAHFNLLRAYDAVPKWLSSEQQVTSSELEDLRKVTTASALIAKDLEDDIDQLLNDVPENPVETVLTQIWDGLEMLRMEAQSMTYNGARCKALDDALDLVDGIIERHGFSSKQRISQIEDELRGSFAAARAAGATFEETCTGVVDVRRDWRADAAEASIGLVPDLAASRDVAGGQASGAGSEPETRGEPAKEALFAKSCGICGSPIAAADYGRCDRCWWLEL